MGDNILIVFFADIQAIEDLAELPPDQELAEEDLDDPQPAIEKGTYVHQLILMRYRTVVTYLFTLGAKRIEHVRTGTYRTDMKSIGQF